MLQLLEILVLGVMRLAQSASCFFVYLVFTHTDQVDKDNELGIVYTTCIMLYEMRQEIINEFLISFCPLQTIGSWSTFVCLLRGSNGILEN